jgi:hypothetical protein
MLRVHKYDVKLEYLKGQKNVIADALSRVSPMKVVEKDYTAEGLIPLHSLTSSIPATTSIMDQARTSTTQDQVLGQLKVYIINGWPKYRNQINPCCSQYWNYKEELILEDGIIFKGERMVIPQILRKSFLKDLHRSHMGEEKTKLFARTSVFWPGINGDIENTVKQCLPCQQTRPAQQQQVLNSHDVPARPWQKVGADLFEYNGQQYLLVADYYSNYPFVRHLRSTTSAAVIVCLRTLFSEHGTPEIVFSDNGPQFASKEFKEFSNKFGFKAENSSPRYPQANGLIEIMVKTIKDLFRRASASGEDPLLSVQAYRATPSSSKLPSPAEMLFGRKIRTKMPIRTILSDQAQAHREVKIDAKKAQQAAYDTKARTYEDLQEYQNILVQLDTNKRFWQPATIVKVPNDTPSGPRTYQVQTKDGARYLRNRKNIRPSTAGATQGGSPTNAKEHPAPPLVTAPRADPGPPKGSNPPPGKVQDLPETGVPKSPVKKVIPPDPPAALPEVGPVLPVPAVPYSRPQRNRVPPKKYEPECFQQARKPTRKK